MFVQQLAEDARAVSACVAHATIEIRGADVSRRHPVGVDDEHLAVVSGASRGLDDGAARRARAVVADDDRLAARSLRLAAMLDRPCVGGVP